jgi:beta-glucosidase
VVELEVAAQACTVVDASGRRVTEEGELELRVGPSSRAETLLRASFTIA